MTFKKGQLILLDYTAKIKDSGEVFESTNEEEAKKHSIHDPNLKYMPKLVSVGEAWVLKGLDDALPETKRQVKKRQSKFLLKKDLVQETKAKLE